MTFKEFITKAEEKVTEAASVVVTLTKLVDTADGVADKIPAGLLPSHLKEARATLDVIRSVLDQAAGMIEEAKDGSYWIPSAADTATDAAPDAAPDATDAAPDTTPDAAPDTTPDPAPEVKVKVEKIDPAIIAARLAENRAKQAAKGK